MAGITMVFGLAPAIAPVIGGRLHASFGWRSVFVFLTLLGVLLAATWRHVPGLAASLVTFVQMLAFSLIPGVIAPLAYGSALALACWTVVARGAASASSPGR